MLPLVGTSPPVLSSRVKIGQGKRAYIPAIGPAEVELHAAGRLFAAGRYSEAGSRCQAAATAALAAGNLDLAVRATSNGGACQFALHQYESALQSFLTARRLAVRAGNSSASAALDGNIASIYSEMGEVESAARWIEDSLHQIHGRERRLFLPKLEIQMAALRANQGRMKEAGRLFRDGIEAAADAGDLDTYALGCNRMGEAFLLAGDLERAEPPLIEAFRVRKLHHLPLDTSYHRLGRLRLAQGDLESASNLLDRAVELATHAQNLMPTWDIYYSRGLVRLKQGRLGESLADLRIAVRLAREWRWTLPTAETARVSAAVMVDQTWAALIDAAGRLYEQTGDASLVHEMFAAAEENRAVAAASGSTPGMPPQWWEALGRLQRAEIAGLADASPPRRQAIEDARAELTRIEASSGPREAPYHRTTDQLAARIQSALGPDTTLFSFHLGETDSWLWMVDRQRMEVRHIPGRADVERQVADVSRAIQGGTAEFLPAAARLYTTLFGQVPPRFAKRSRWLLSLDGGLFNVPIAALVENRGIRPVYVAEEHAVQVIPGVLPWLESKPRGGAPVLDQSDADSLFLGIGDPIYNLADPRYPRPAGSPTTVRRPAPFSLFAAVPAAAAFSLPRLAASGPELAACATAWRGGRVALLEGADATRARVIAELHSGPAVIHFATHFLTSAEASRHLVFDQAGMHRNVGPEEMIALSLDAARTSELLTAAEIAHWRVRADLVVLSGCHSADGAALPGAGRLGLTRAWLEAGARAVAGSLWDTPDETGSLFATLYRNLSARRPADPALALNTAQRQMIRAGGWQAQPRYWGAYFVVAYD